jgi:hypothetical protein
MVAEQAMRISNHKFADFVCSGLVLAILVVAYARTLAPGITWANNGADSGDLVAAAATLGIAHPSGYPTYLLLAHCFQLIPVGDLAFRATLMSAVAALLAVFLVYRIVLVLLGNQSWRAAISAGTAALALGLSQVFWSQAVVAEVYTLNAFFTALMLLFALQAMRRPTLAWWELALHGLIAGLALGNHITAGLVVAGWFGVALVYARASARARVAALAALSVGAGLLVYLYLPIRAAAHPAINWGVPVDWAGFWWVISGQPYRQLAFGLPANFLAGRVAAWAGLLAQQFGPLGLVLGFCGLLYARLSARRYVWLTGGIVLAASAFAIGYNTADSYAYLIPAYLIFAIWVGLGVAIVLDLIARWKSAFAPLAAALALGALAWPAPATAAAVDASHDRRAIEFAASVLAAAPPQAIVITTSDRDTFPLWYYHYALGERPDIVVLVEPLLDFGWYRENLRAIYPALQIPAQSVASSAADVIALNDRPGRVCRVDLDRTRMPPMVCG